MQHPWCRCVRNCGSAVGPQRTPREACQTSERRRNGGQTVCMTPFCPRLSRELPPRCGWNVAVDDAGISARVSIRAGAVLPCYRGVSHYSRPYRLDGARAIQKGSGGTCAQSRGGQSVGWAKSINWNSVTTADRFQIAFFHLPPARLASSRKQVDGGDSADTCHWLLLS